ncbi:MAG: ABC transporter permease [Anaerolineae bacterium]|nr:ABC transporter permease [Anaerolineae bacterium]
MKSDRWIRGLLLWLIVFLLLPSLLTSASPTQTQPDQQLLLPSVDHLLGTDYLGRDIWARLLYGGQNTLLQAGLSTLIAMTIGGTLGIISAISRPIIDRLLVALINALLSIPGLLLALVLLTLLGRGSGALIVAIGITQIAPVALIVRTATQQVLLADYMLASYAMGATSWHRVRVHILRVLKPLLLTYGLVIFGYAIMNGAALAFLGFQSPGTADWGVMLAEARNSFRLTPWPAVPPGLSIVVTMMLLNRIVTHRDATTSG